MNWKQGVFLVLRLLEGNKDGHMGALLLKGNSNPMWQIWLQ